MTRCASTLSSQPLGAATGGSCSEGPDHLPGAVADQSFLSALLPPKHMADQTAHGGLPGSGNVVATEALSACSIPLASSKGLSTPAKFLEIT